MFKIPIEISSKFKEMFNAIDAQKPDLNVKSYKLKPSSL